MTKENIEILPVPFDKVDGVPYKGVFLSNDGGYTGILITNDKTFDSGEYETVGDEYKILGFKVIEVFS
jgi:hypothetical protein